MAGVLTWEQWAAENGVPAEVPPKEGEGQNADRHHWFDVHNQWTEYIAQNGVNPNSVGIYNKHEQGQSIYSGWRQNWQQALANDPKAQAFASSPEFKKYMQIYGDPWVAYQNSSYLNSQINNIHSGGMVQAIPGTGLFYTGGPHGTFYNQYNQQVNPTGLTYGGMTYNGKGWVDAQGNLTRGPVLNPNLPGYQPGGGEVTGYGPIGGGGATGGRGGAPGVGGQYGILGSSGNWQTGGFEGSGYAPFSGTGNAGGGPVSFSTTGYNPYGFTTATTAQGAGSSDSLGTAGRGKALPADQYKPGSVGAAVGNKAGSQDPNADPGTFNYTAPPYGGPNRPQFNFPGVPKFTPPTFTAPTAVTMQNDPGYQFRLNEGLKALQASAAARGVLNSGGTLKGIEDYGQNYASQEYGNVFNRALQTFGTAYQGAKDAYAPLFANYQNLFGAEQNAGLAAYNQAWQRYQFGLDDEFRREQMLAQMQAPA